MLLFVLLLLLLFLLIIILNRKENNIENKIIEGYDKFHWRLYNQNHDKPWMKNDQVSANNPYVDEIPRSSNNDKNFPTYILEIFKEKYAKRVLDNLIQEDKPLPFKMTDFKPIVLSNDELYKFNQYTWFNRVNLFTVYDKNQYEEHQQEFPTANACLKDVNKLVRNFIKRFNQTFNISCNEAFRRKIYGFSPFTIFKYRINSIKQKLIKNKKQNQNNGCISNYQIILVLTRDESPVGFTLFIDVVYDNENNNDKMYLINYDIIGYYTTDKLFLPKGDNPVDKNNYYLINPIYRDNPNDPPITYRNAEANLIQRQQYNYDNTDQRQYTCFNMETDLYNPLSNDNSNQPIEFYVYNKYNCESSYDMFGRRKPRGLWDRPCISDSECEFYGANKNYPNDKGKCDKTTGFCTLPKQMGNMGFHYNVPYNKENKREINLKTGDVPICDPPDNQVSPLCYNCKSVNKTEEWKPVTRLDSCCDEQKDKEKYPYLNGPDYAFFGDVNDRINFYNQKQYKLNSK